MAKHGGAKIVFEKVKVENMEEYACHKVVRAVKISMIGIEETEGHGLITPIVPEDSKLTAFIVSPEYIEQHQPQRGGYYVVYEGYESYSPAEAFESGYTLKDKD